MPKKLIIVITLLFTILASFFEFRPRPSTFNSNVLIEIGQYNFNEQNSFALIENAPTLIQDLNIVFVHKQQNGIKDPLDTSIIENSLINIGITSSSSEIAINSVNKITSYILNRHENIINANIQCCRCNFFDIRKH